MITRALPSTHVQSNSSDCLTPCDWWALFLFFLKPILQIGKLRQGSGILLELRKYN